jgi:hypothetical protein
VDYVLGGQVVLAHIFSEVRYLPPKYSSYTSFPGSKQTGITYIPHFCSVYCVFFFVRVIYALDSSSAF